ncbi:MAG TPA: winged helix-turn-helix domain-containing protein [Caulobacteraceae bacterium]|nr:winged helix-turn-helix domain-containing protein [Caulobacteraceae bacterium]
MDHRLEHSWDDDEIDLADTVDFTLGALTLSPSTREIRWSGGAEIVQPRVMQALVCLAQAEGAVVSRDELVRRCWGGRIVGEDAINRCIAKARQLAGAAGGEAAFVIETIPRVGYRLRRAVEVAAPVARQRTPSRVWLLAGAAACVPALALGAWLAWRPAPTAAAPAPPMRSVAVLPIQNLTGDPKLEPAVDRLTEDITYVAGRSGYISVPPRTATFALKGKPVDERALGRTLEVRNVVIGSLRRDGAGFRVNYQMVDTATGQVVDTRDLGVARPDGALPEPQLALAVNEQIESAIDRRWTAAELAKGADDRDPENIMARLHQMEEAPGHWSVAETQRLIATAASEIKPDSPLAPEFDTMACWYYLDMIEGGYATSSAQRAAWAKQALDYGGAATALRPDLTGAHGCRSEVFGQIGQWDAGLSEAQYIIDTYPLATTPYEARGEAEMARGQFVDAVRDFTEVGERGGEDASSAIGLARLFQGQDAAAIQTLQARTAIDPMDADAYFFLSAAYELTGDHRNALTAADAYRRVRKDSSAWRALELSREPAYLGPAKTIRTALHVAGLDEPTAPGA